MSPEAVPEVPVVALTASVEESVRPEATPVAPAHPASAEKVAVVQPDAQTGGVEPAIAQMNVAKAAGTPTTIVPATIAPETIARTSNAQTSEAEPSPTAPPLSEAAAVPAMTSSQAARVTPQADHSAIEQAPARKPATSASEPAAAAPAPTKARPTADTEAQARPAATVTGTVVLDVKPWAEIRVDGVARGHSPPLKQLTLPAGRHTIELRNPAAEPIRQQIEVRANQRAVVKHQF
jgi:hypothetical protein